MSKAEIFPQIDGEEPISLRHAIGENRRHQIETAFNHGIGITTLIEAFGSKTVEAALTSPDFVEAVDPAPIQPVRTNDAS